LFVELTTASKAVSTFVLGYEVYPLGAAVGLLDICQLNRQQRLAFQTIFTSL
jgi:hypothetical protein